MVLVGSGVMEVPEISEPWRGSAAFLAERGYLPKGVPLLKRVFALRGDTVAARAASSSPMADATPSSASTTATAGPLPVWQGCRVLDDGEAFFMNWDAPDSFDSRYFGPLPISTIVGRAVPVWTADDTDPATDDRSDRPAASGP